MHRPAGRPKFLTTDAVRLGPDPKLCCAALDCLRRRVLALVAMATSTIGYVGEGALISERSERCGVGTAGAIDLEGVAWRAIQQNRPRDDDRHSILPRTGSEPAGKVSLGANLAARRFEVQAWGRRGGFEEVPATWVYCTDRAYRPISKHFCYRRLTGSAPAARVLLSLTQGGPSLISNFTLLSRRAASPAPCDNCGGDRCGVVLAGIHSLDATLASAFIARWAPDTRSRLLKGSSACAGSLVRRKDARHARRFCAMLARSKQEGRPCRRNKANSGSGTSLSNSGAPAAAPSCCFCMAPTGSASAALLRPPGRALQDPGAGTPGIWRLR
jgi:hypothetical protein